MLHHDRTPYRWQDHVITPQRAIANLLASMLVLAVIGGALLAEHAPHPQSVIAAHATEWTPPLAQTAKRTAPHSLHGFGGC
jgi:hypothetical protein